MRSSSAFVASIAALSAAAPAFAAPMPIVPTDESGALSFGDVANGFLDFVKGAAPVVQSAADIFTTFHGKTGSKREVTDILARDLIATLQARQDESGALSWQDVYDWGNKALDTIADVTPAVTSAVGAYKGVHSRDIEQIAARAYLEARNVPLTTDESGAISTQDLKDFGHGFVQGFTKTVSTLLPIASSFLKREDIENIAREVAASALDESGALSWQDVKDFGKGFVQGFTKTASTLLPIASSFLKREDMELFVRQLAEADESGAISWDDVKDFGKGFVQGFTKTASTLLPIASSFLKREEMELLARQLAEADESGAISWQDVKDFGHGFVQGFTKTASTLLPIASAFLKREEMELLARQLVEARSLNELD